MDRRNRAAWRWLLGLAIAASSTVMCTAPFGPRPTGTPTSPPPSATRAPSSTPPLTMTPAASPTPGLAPVTLSPETQQLAIQTSRLIASVETAAHILQETALQVASGALDPSEVPALIETVAGAIRAMGIVLSYALNEPGLEAQMDQAVALYVQTGCLADRWASDEVDAQTVLQEVAPIVDRIGLLVDEAEAMLAEVYQVDVAPLAAERRQSLEDI